MKLYVMNNFILKISNSKKSISDKITAVKKVIYTEKNKLCQKKRFCSLILTLAVYTF